MSLIVYTKDGCPWCEDVLKLLNTKRVEYEEREVRGNKVFFDEMVQKSNQDKAPTIDYNGIILADTDADAIEQFLRSKGVI